MDRDAVLLETVRVRRARLRAALVYGPVEGRRAVTDNVRRVIGSIVLAAIICVVCIAVSFVLSILAQQERDRLEQEQQQLEQQQQFEQQQDPQSAWAVLPERVA